MIVMAMPAMASRRHFGRHEWVEERVSKVRYGVRVVSIQRRTSVAKGECNEDSSLLGADRERMGLDHVERRRHLQLSVACFILQPESAAKAKHQGESEHSEDRDYIESMNSIRESGIENRDA